ADHRMPLAARQVDALAQVGHEAVNAQHLVAMAQALPLRIDQDQDRPSRMLPHGLEDRLRLGQRDLDADRRVAGGADHGDRLAVDLRRAR
ncbi:hypothetical protein LTR94_029442, partial [Friedmanniomyces endolithicus]